MAIGAAALAVFVALIAYGARGARGSDQYWYMADLVMAKSGRGMVSNWITPMLWIRDSGYSAESLPPPVHHVPVTYLAAGINAVVDNPYLAWVLCNALLAVVASLLLYFVAVRVVRPTSAAVVGAIFLVSPQTVWFTLNPLMEQSLVLGAVVLGVGAMLMFTRPVAGVLVMAAAVAFMSASRASNLLLLPFGIALLCWLAWRRRASWWLVFLFGAASGALWLLLGALLPQYPIVSWKAILAVGSPADTRGYGQGLVFYTDDVHLTLESILTKAVAGLGRAFVPSSAEELIMETLTIALVVVGVIFGARTGRAKVLAWWVVSLFGVYLAASMVLQSQYRYLAPALPLALVLVAAAAERYAVRVRVPPTARTLAIGALGLAVALTSATLTAQYADLALQEKEVLERDAAVLRGVGDGATLWLDGPSLTFGDTPDPLSGISSGYLVAPSILVRADGTDRESCVPAEEIERWQIARVAAPRAWSDERVQAAFCPTPNGEQVNVVPDGADLLPFGRRLLTVQR